MKILFDKNDHNLKKLVENLDNSIFFSDALNNYIYNQEELELDPFNDDINSVLKEQFFSLNSLTPSDVKHFPCQLSFTRLSPIDYKNDAYVKKVNPKPFKYNDIKLNCETYFPYEIFLFDQTKTKFERNLPLETSYLGYFPSQINYLTIKDKSTNWMVITPYEIQTMKDSIKKAKGHVVTFGLGLGYFAFHASNKDNVSKVAVVELNKDVITVFTKCILPFFEHKEKIELINLNAKDYLKKNPKFDYLFIDTYHNEVDGLSHFASFYPYLKTCDKSKYDFWIKESIDTYFRRLINADLISSLNKEKFIFDDPFLDKLFNRLRNLTKDMEFHSFEELLNFYSASSLDSIYRQII